MADSCSLDNPDLIISSPANRTYGTALIYLNARNIAIEKLQLRAEIYAANTQRLLHVLKALPESVQDVWLFGHNPGLNDLASFVLDSPIDNIVTSAYVTLASDGQSWSELCAGSGRLINFKRP